MKKNKVATVTWHYFPNYGSALQSYALYTTIKEKFNIDCDVVNYRNYKYSPKGLIKLLKNNKFTYKIICKFMKKYRAYKFYEFLEGHISMTEEFNNINDLDKLNNRYSTFICGSDQIWSPNVLDEVYLLDFVSNENIRISYAPSIVIDNITEEQKKLYNENLHKFNHLSVRENRGKEIIYENTGLKPEVVLDPTLLLSKEDYSKITENIEHQNYILCYILGDINRYIDYINEFKHRYNLNVLAIINDKNELRYGDINICDAGPKEFLGYFKNASFVITDSFHGVSFSIIHEKEFLVLERFSKEDKICQNDRIYNLLSKLELMDRLVEDLKDYKNIEAIKKINYSNVKNYLEIEKGKSLSYLSNALKV